MSLSRESPTPRRLSTRRLSVASVPTSQTTIKLGPAGFSPPCVSIPRGTQVDFTLNGTSRSLTVTVEFNGQPTSELFGTSSFTVSSEGPSSQQVQQGAQKGRTYTLTFDWPPASGSGRSRGRPDVPVVEPLRGTIEVSP